MFSVTQIELAHEQVKSGADFPKYIQEIKKMGVIAFETWVTDSHTEYFGANGFQQKSEPQYENLMISDRSDIVEFSHRLKIHQQGKTDYITFCRDCAETGVEKWVVSLEAMTCTYFDKSGTKMLVENVPQP